MLWISDQWKDYEVLDTSDGERLERWGKYILVRPDPQVIWNTPHAAGMPVSSCAAAPAARIYGPRFCFGTGIPSPFRVSMPGLD